MNCQKSFSRLMRGIFSNVHENHYCLGCFHSFRCQSTLEKHTSLCKEHTFCKTKFPMGNDRIKKHKHESKSIRINDIIYVDLECILTKYDTCFNSFNKSHTANVSQHIPLGYSICLFRHHNKSSETKYYRGRDCIEKLCDELKQISNNTINAKEKEHIPLSKDQLNAHANAKTCYICNRHFNNKEKSSYYKNVKKVIHHNHYTGLYEGAAHALCCLKYTRQRDIPVVIHNGSNCDFHLIIKELANEFREDIHCIPCDKEKYKSFSIPIKYVENDYPFMLKFMDSNNFMMGSLESHVDNLSNLHSCNCSNSSNQDIKIEYDKYYIYTTCRTWANSTKQKIKSLITKFPNTYHFCDIVLKSSYYC